MRKRALIMLGLAVILGLASVLLMQGWISRQMKPTDPAVSTVTVVVARMPLAFGNRIQRENVTLVDWPTDATPPGAFTSIEELVGEKEDRVVLRAMEPGEPVLASKVSGLGGRATLSTILNKDMRAVTIRVNDVLGVGGFVLPGDRVDVLLTRGDYREDPKTDVLLQNLRVLGIDQDASDRKDQPKVARAVTLEVSPEQAQKLTLGAQVGTLSLALRNEADADLATLETISVDDLRPTKQAAAPAKTAPRPVIRASARPADSGIQIRIIRGTDSSSTTVKRE